MEGFHKSFVISCLLMTHALAAETGTVRGIVHDPQHRPLPDAQVVLQGTSYTKTVTSDSNGEFQLNSVPEGAYTIAVSAPGFRPLDQRVNVTASKAPVLHLQLELGAISTSVDVS